MSLAFYIYFSFWGIRNVCIILCTDIWNGYLGQE